MSAQGAAIGAAAGATYALATGKDPIKYAMIGGAVGGAGPGAASALGLGGTTATTAGALTPAAAGTTAGTATGSAITAGAGGSAAGNLTAVPAYGVPSFQVGASAVPSAGVFSTPAQVSTFQPLTYNQATATGLQRPFSTAESLLNPNIESSSMAPSFMEQVGSGAGQLGQFAQQNPVLTQMAMQSAQQMMQQPQRRASPPGLLRGTQMQVSAPQYQVGVPQVSLI
jgi:hypothetical protein